MQDYMTWLLFICFICIANSGQITARQFNMEGDGGNIVVGKYRYGQADWKDRPLKVTRVQKGRKSICKMENKYVLVAKPTTDEFFWPPDQCFDPALSQAPVEEKCNPPSPNSDATNTSFSQVHDALFLITWLQGLLENEFKDNTLAECCKQLRVCVLFPVSGLTFISVGERCDIYFGREGKDTVDQVAQSVVGHKLAYSYILCTSNLVPESQSGAVMAAFSYFFGIILKASLNNYKTDWKYGSEIIKKNANRKAIRHMDDPPLDGESIDHVKDYSSDIPIHQAAGVYSKAIFNLASMKGWNIQKTFKLFLNACKQYWWSNITFSDGLCGLINAAKDLSFEEMDIEEAFDKVGVKCKQKNAIQSDTMQSIVKPQCKDLMGSCKKKCKRKNLVDCPMVSGCKGKKVCCFPKKKAPAENQCKNKLIF